jgi:hypothetical protein
MENGVRDDAVMEYGVRVQKTWGELMEVRKMWGESTGVEMTWEAGCCGRGARERRGSAGARDTIRGPVKEDGAGDGDVRKGIVRGGDEREGDVGRVT